MKTFRKKEKKKGDQKKVTAYISRAPKMGSICRDGHFTEGAPM